MKIIGIMCVKNEDWVLEASLHAALQWCDSIVLVDHSSTDTTYDIYNRLASHYVRRINYSRWESTKLQKCFDPHTKGFIEIPVVDPDAPWDEMDMRQHSLVIGRKYRGTHFAIIDADEILTANLKNSVRDWAESLQPGQCMNLPMLAMRTLDQYQNDESVWSRAQLTIMFRDDPVLTWKPAGDGYHHHHRAPYGIAKNNFVPHTDKSVGGVMHLQFANRRRLMSKHILYRMVDHLRWPGRETVDRLNEKYDEALVHSTSLSKVPEEWWRGYRKDKIRLETYPWQDGEIRKLIRKNGRPAFSGLDLKGM